MDTSEHFNAGPRVLVEGTSHSSSRIHPPAAALRPGAPPAYQRQPRRLHNRGTVQRIRRRAAPVDRPHARVPGDPAPGAGHHEGEGPLHGAGSRHLPRAGRQPALLQDPMERLHPDEERPGESVPREGHEERQVPRVKAVRRQRDVHPLPVSAHRREHDRRSVRKRSDRNSGHEEGDHQHP